MTDVLSSDCSQLFSNNLLPDKAPSRLHLFPGAGRDVSSTGEERRDLPMVSAGVCVCVRTENEDTVPQRLGSVGLHGDVQDGWVSCHDAHAVVLLRLPEHPQQLIGYDAIQG